MSRRSGSYRSVTRGVSEQSAQDRLPGQQWAQDNMISDPVKGLARRWGSLRAKDGAVNALVNDAPTQQDLSSYREYTCVVGTDELSILYRGAAKPSSSSAHPVFVYNKTDKAFLPVVLHGNVEGGVDTLAQMLDAGMTSCVSIGRYLYFSTALPVTMNTCDLEGKREDHGVINIRSGANSRTYSVTVTGPSGSPQTFSFTTPTSYYPGTLDTSDIDADDSEYQKKVNDRTNEYNTQVNQWISKANAEIQPEFIADQLGQQMQAAGVMVQISGGNILVSGCSSLSVDDGGAGDFATCVFGSVNDTDKLSLIHTPGKVVAVQPTDKPDSTKFYMRAVRNQPINWHYPGYTDGFPSTEWAEVVWEESQPIKRIPARVFVVGLFLDGTLHLVNTHGALDSVEPGVEHPWYESSKVGDEDSAPTPQFLTGKVVTYLDLFQDRLIICAGSTVFGSRAGDYLNWWKHSVLTDVADDPLETYAKGYEGDIIRQGAQVEKALVFFGDRAQYGLPAQQLLTPQTAVVAAQTSYKDTTGCNAVANGNLIFFTQPREEYSDLHQLQIGNFADSFAGQEASQQLDTYIAGKAVQVIASTSPNFVWIRTDGLDNGVYCFQYIDSLANQQRLADAWHRWTWDNSLGQMVAMTTFKGELGVFYVRDDAGVAYLTVDMFNRAARQSVRPYLDSLRPYGEAHGPAIVTSSSPFTGDVDDDCCCDDYPIDTGTKARPGPPNCMVLQPGDMVWVGSIIAGQSTRTGPIFTDFTWHNQNDSVAESQAGALGLPGHMVVEADRKPGPDSLWQGYWKYGNDVRGGPIIWLGPYTNVGGSEAWKSDPRWIDGHFKVTMFNWSTCEILREFEVYGGRLRKYTSPTLPTSNVTTPTSTEFQYFDRPVTRYRYQFQVEGSSTWYGDGNEEFNWHGEPYQWKGFYPDSLGELQIPSFGTTIYKPVYPYSATPELGETHGLFPSSLSALVGIKLEFL